MQPGHDLRPRLQGREANDSILRQAVCADSGCRARFCGGRAEAGEQRERVDVVGGKSGWWIPMISIDEGHIIL